MKKIISILLSISILATMLVSPISATGTQSDLELSFSGETEIVEIGGTQSVFYSYTENGKHIVEVREENGDLSIVEFDDATGYVYVNGRNIVTVDSMTARQVNLLATNDNWGEETVTTGSMDIAGLSVSLVAAVIVGYFTLWNGYAMEAAQTIVELGISWLYFKKITQFNYEDYFPKVGYRLTEELHSGEACNSSTYIIGRTMTGKR